MNRTFLFTSLACLAVFFYLPAEAVPAGKGKPSPSRAVKALIGEFSLRDLNGDGRITLDEFAAGGTPSGNRRFQQMDRNRNRSISLSEFATNRGVTLPRGARPFIDRAKKDFRNLDTNRNGRVSLEEIAAVTTFVDGNALEAYFSELDLDSSGAISLEEWRAGNDYPRPGPAHAFGRYLGLTLGEAEDLARRENRSTRVVRIDGEWMPMTMDYRLDRLNFSIDGGVVTDVSAG